MKYRNFGRLDWKVSALGFGCMRLPCLDEHPMSGNINEKESIKLIRHAIDRGVNQVDTAYPYHGGNSEIVTGKALKDGYREKVRIATKSPVWLIKEEKDFDTYLNEQLKKLRTEHIDFYLLHALGKITWENIILKFNVLDKAEAAVKDGRIGHIGFSFHDTYDAFRIVLDGYEGWDFCQIQYNYMDIENQAGLKGLKDAAAKGLAVAVMEPLLGGRLASPPEDIRKMLDTPERKASPADRALQWLWNQPEVSVILSGMNTMEQLEENLASAEKSGINSLQKEELDIINLVRDKFREKMPIPCTKCGYCMPCPSGVEIPRNLEIYNDGIIYEDMKTSSTLYQIFKKFAGEKALASSCNHCMACEEKCPQSISISDWMEKIHKEFGP